LTWKVTEVKKILFPVLQSVRSLSIQTNSRLGEVELPALESMRDLFLLLNNFALTNTSAPVLKSVGDWQSQGR
jgi:hypothetical protein